MVIETLVKNVKGFKECALGVGCVTYHLEHVEWRLCWVVAGGLSRLDLHVGVSLCDILG